MLGNGISIENHNKTEINSVMQYCGKEIYADIPVYKIHANNLYYNKVKNFLADIFKGIDLQNKIIFDDNSQTISIYYYPRIFKSFLTESIIFQLAQILDQNLREPYEFLNQYLTEEYLLLNKNSFNKCDQLFKDYITTHPVEINYSQNIVPADGGIVYNAIPDKIFNNPEDEIIGIGENHNDENPKKIIFNNLNFFQQNGIDVIFLEGLPYESQKLLDEYLSNNNEAMPIELEKILLGPYQRRPKVDLVLEIKKRNLKIRVVGLDSYSTYLADDSHCYNITKRVRAFNYVGFQIIQAERKNNEKAIFFVGVDHLKKSTNYNIPGIATMLGCHCISISDNFGGDVNEIFVASGLLFCDASIKHDVVMESFKENRYKLWGLSDAYSPADIVVIASPNEKMNIASDYTIIKKVEFSSNLKNKISSMQLKSGKTNYLPSASNTAQPIIPIEEVKQEISIKKDNNISRMSDLNEDFLKQKEIKNKPNKFHLFFGMQNTFDWQDIAEELRLNAWRELIRSFRTVDSHEEIIRIINHAQSLRLFNDHRSNYFFTKNTENTRAVRMLQEIKDELSGKRPKDLINKLNIGNENKVKFAQ